jgi:hypothetical protein
MGSDFDNPTSIMLHGWGLWNMKMGKILDVRNIIAGPSASYGCSSSNNTNSWKFAITTLKAHAFLTLGFNTDWLQLYNWQLCNFRLFCEGPCQPFALWVIYTHIYSIGLTIYLQKPPPSIWQVQFFMIQVTKNMTIIFVAQRFQIIASSNFLTQPPKCLLRFCRG